MRETIGSSKILPTKEFPTLRNVLADVLNENGNTTEYMKHTSTWEVCKNNNIKLLDIYSKGNVQFKLDLNLIEDKSINQKMESEWEEAIKIVHGKDRNLKIRKKSFEET